MARKKETTDLTNRVTVEEVANGDAGLGELKVYHEQIKKRMLVIFGEHWEKLNEKNDRELQDIKRMLAELLGYVQALSQSVAQTHVFLQGMPQPEPIIIPTPPPVKEGDSEMRKMLAEIGENLSNLGSEL